MTRHYIIAGIVTAILSASAYKIGYNDGYKGGNLTIEWDKGFFAGRKSAERLAKFYRRDTRVPGRDMPYYHSVDAPCHPRCPTPTPIQGNVRLSTYDPWPTPTPAPAVSGAPCYEPMQKDRQFMFRPVACPDFGAKP